MLLDVDVMPSADRSAFPTAYNEWRERFEGRVEEAAQDGQANQALCKLVAEALDVEANQVAIHRGHTSRRKTLVVRGLTGEAVDSALRRVIEA